MPYFIVDAVVSIPVLLIEVLRIIHLLRIVVLLPIVKLEGVLDCVVVVIGS